jgi:hypothetical protein
MNAKLLLFLCVGLIAIQAQAHHSFISQYDDNQIETIEGKVTKVWLQNPHSRVYVEVLNEAGEQETWEAETYPRNILVRKGWRPDDLNEGDLVTVTGRRARNGANRLQMFEIVRPSDGWVGVGFDQESTD